MKFAADENFDGRILEGLLERLPDLDIVRVQDTEMYQRPDNILLEWLANEDRVLLTRDKRTMPNYVSERINKGKYVAGVVIVKNNISIGTAIDELEYLLDAGEPEDFHYQIHFIPLE